ncbi:MAG: FAD-binding oxidoreductase [Thalassobaculales bacterium]
MPHPDVVIVGAGINGCAAAFHLARAGCRVTVVERYAPGAMASGWTLAGVRQSGRHPAELPLARAAVALWAGLDEELDGDVGYRREGNLRLARSEAEVAVIRTLVEDQRRAGLDLAFLPDSRTVREVCPAIAPTVLAASFCPTDGHADPQAAVAAYRAAAIRHGAVFRSGVAATAVLTAAGRTTGVALADGTTLAAGAVLVAAGIQANALLAPLGLGVPLRVPMVTVVQSAPLPPLLRPVLGVANADCAGRQQIDGRLRVTSGLQGWHGAMDADGPLPAVHPTAASLAATIATVSAVLPALAAAPVARVWAGLIDLTPDALPVIERAPELDGLVIAAGFSGHGFGIAPATGRLLSELVLGETPHLPLDAFRRARFAAAAGQEQAALTLHG